MNTDAIERFFKADNDCRRVFQGVNSVDTLSDRPSLLVCNTNKSTNLVENISIRLDVGLLNNSNPT